MRSLIHVLIFTNIHTRLPEAKTHLLLSLDVECVCLLGYHVTANMSYKEKLTVLFT